MFSTTEVNGWSVYGIINFFITRNKLWMNHHLGTVLHTMITLYQAVCSPSNSSNSCFVHPLTNFLTEILLLLYGIVISIHKGTLKH